MKKILTSTLFGALITVVPLAAFAQTASVTTGTSVTASTGSAKVGAKASTTANITKIITRSDNELTRRITNLNQTAIRISAMKNVSATEKSSLEASISTEIANLTTLKTKIDADTDATTLKTDTQSITEDYRVYALVLPQDHIVAATDRIATIVAEMQQLGTKLSARITAAQSAGKSVAGAQIAYTDMQAKLTDASTQSQAALTETQNLTPDKGDATIKASNAAAIKDAVAKIKTATTDLTAARADVKTILEAVKGTGTSGTATSTMKTNATISAQ